MKVLVTGGAGFIGSHAAEKYAAEGHDVVIYDNIMREQLLNKKLPNAEYNKDFLTKTYKNILFLKKDIRDQDAISNAVRDVDLIIHTAGQTAVTTSVLNPRPDFEINVMGTLNVLEAARNSSKNPTIIYCSTNKVFGNNVNNVDVVEKEKRYEFESDYKLGIPETFSIDHSEHTPYGCSKLAGDIYVQDYAETYGLRAGVFRMSCIYGTRQFGVEDQGWVSWFTIANLLKRKIKIFGDGKQVRDVLWVKDLIELYDAFFKSKIKHGVYNAGGGPENTMSLLELLELLENLTGYKSPHTFENWRPSDQKVFVADIRKAKQELGWQPKVNPKDGVSKLFEFVSNNKEIF